jgi:hypothetical protein
MAAFNGSTQARQWDDIREMEAKQENSEEIRKVNCRSAEGIHQLVDRAV